MGKRRKPTAMNLREALGKRQQRHRGNFAIEPLEPRELLAIGPQLASINPNVGAVLRDGDTREVAPRELTFIFNEGQIIDAATLDAIRITRSGGDEQFEPASTITDMGTAGAVQIRLTAVTPGPSGNGWTLQFTSNNLDGPSPPVIDVDVNTKVISIELNTNPGNKTTAQSLIDAINNNPLTSGILVATREAGAPGTDVTANADDIGNVALSGANTARAISDLGSGGAVLLDFQAVQSGRDGNGTTVEFMHADQGGPAPATIRTSGNTVTIRLNTNADNETTVQEVLTLIQSNAAASQRITANLLFGDPEAGIASPSVGLAPLVLEGARDDEIDPGFIGVDPDHPNEVIVRFGSVLPDDVYSIDILGAGDGQILTNSLGEAFNSESDFRINFDLDLGAQVVSVVPQPISRDGDNLIHHRDQIQVYFNDDNLDDMSAEDPAFYKLIFTNNSATNADDTSFSPTEADYDKEADLVTLTFSQPIDELADGAFRLRIGTNEAIPIKPLETQLSTTVRSDFNTGGVVDVEFRSKVPVNSGNAIELMFTAVDQGAAGAPAILIDGRTITVEVNSNAGNQTTAQELIDTISADPVVGLLLAGSIARGVPGADITTGEEISMTLVNPGSAFATAVDMGLLADRGVIITSAIDPEYFPLPFPGADKDPGQTFAPDFLDAPLITGDDHPGIVTIPYNFRTNYGAIGSILPNLITEVQKERVREVFEFYTHLTGIQFIETVEDGITVATGDMRVLNPFVDTGEGGVLGIAGVAVDPLLGAVPTAIMDNAEQWDDAFGLSEDPATPSYFLVAMHEIGHLLNLNHTPDLPPLTVMRGEVDGAGVDEVFDASNRIEPVFPGDHDIAHLLNLYRTEAKDIDLYKFDIAETGVFTAETIAERLADSSLLDPVITLYRQSDDGEREMIARNDDYFSEDSFIELLLAPGHYIVGVSSSGNTQFDPTIEDSGIGGATDGQYDLRLNFRKLAGRTIVDSTGTAFDGDADGIPGGVYNFWFRATSPENTIIVDKLASRVPVQVFSPNGDPLPIHSGNVFQEIDTALSQASALVASRGITNPVELAQSGPIVRIVGNGGFVGNDEGDGKLYTPDDNLPYEIGFDVSQAIPIQLADGVNLNVPQGTTVMIDSGAVFKMRNSRASVGSSSPSIDRNGGAIQILGVPRAQDESGNVLFDAQGRAISQNVIFTSFDDEVIGGDSSQIDTQPSPGDWGGIVFRSDLDRANGLFEWEQAGIFLNYVNNADIRYGGGFVIVDSVPRIITPIHVTDARPTIANNVVHFSADAAMSANPDSFEETNFHSPFFQGASPFTSDYDRVGPDIHGNTLIDNTTNGLFIRVPTPAGDQPERLSVSARWDDTDVVHVLEETLLIDGTPGGPTGDLDFVPGGAPALQPGVGLQRGRAWRGVEQDAYTKTARLDARLSVDPGIVVKADGARIETRIGAQFIAEGSAEQPIVFTSLADDRFGAAGTFDTGDDGADSSPQGGDWGGLYFGHLSSASVDRALITFAGGVTRVDGEFAGFNAIEIHQANARIANTTLEFNAAGMGGNAETNRFGRGFNGSGTIYVRGAQPSIVQNNIQHNAGPAISVNANSLNSELVTDIGRSTGFIDLAADDGFEFGKDNQGPLIRGNRLMDNEINGMQVRGAILTTESIWDDTGIVHVLFDTIFVPNFHTYGGLRLESSPNASLVVKLSGANAGFTATGTPLDIHDRIGGSLQIIGQSDFPVILTSISDGSVGAGEEPDGTPLVNTLNEDLPGRTNPPGSFQINVNLDPALQAVPEVVTAINRAIQVWESFIEDPISLNVDMLAQTIGPGVAGFAVSEYAFVDFDTIRDLMALDARAHEAVVSGIPRFGNLQTVTPAGVTIDQTVQITRANAQAIGVDPSVLPNTPSAFGTGVIDGNITFNALDIFPGTDPNLIFDTAVHELGHMLGFDSNVDLIDGGQLNVGLTPLDMFRVAPGTGGVDFTNTPRILDPTLDQVFFDGGNFLPVGIPIAGIDRGDIPFSTGEFRGDGNQASHWKAANLINGVELGNMGPFGGMFSAQDRRAFDLIGWDVVSSGIAGDWRSIQIDEFANDRNVAVVVEQEEPGPDASGTNSTPSTAQFIGMLATDEKGGDENLRLGFQVHGFISEPSDLDVYSFDAAAGTEIWIDLDRTTHALDAVVELVDANGNAMARSDDSYFEAIGQEDLFSRNGAVVNSLPKDPFLAGYDFYTTNTRDPGMRIVLPGAPGTTNTYHIRVRSSSAELVMDAPDFADLNGGLTTGVYQMQIRLQEQNEVPGATIQFADIRFATNGIEIFGQPGHSPLTGEAGEVDTATAPNDDFATAQYIGNLFETDRLAISVAGFLEDRISVSDVDRDWYQVDLAGPTIFDMDYADGFARANTAVSLYDSTGTLIFYLNSSNVSDDLSAPARGANVDDLSRGSTSKGDPLTGPIYLLPDRYFVAVTPAVIAPTELSSPTIRLEPIDSISKIVEDHVDFAGGSTYSPPLYQSPLFDPNSIVPWDLGDVTLFVSADAGPNQTQVSLVDPVTGIVEANLPQITSINIADLAFRPDGILHAFNRGEEFNPTGATDENSGGFYEINSTTGGSTFIVDDGIVTYEIDFDSIDPMMPPTAMNPPDAIESHPFPGPDDDRIGDGIQIDGMTYGLYNGGFRLFGSGSRGLPASQLLGVSILQNILYEYETIDGFLPENENSGVASSFADLDRAIPPDERLYDGAGTQIRERGEILTAARVEAVPATEQDMALNTIFNVVDGIPLTVNTGSSITTFEFDAGFDIFQDIDAFVNRTVHDGNFFILDDFVYQFDTGVVITAGSGGQIADGQTITVNSTAGNSVTFEFDLDGDVAAGTTPIEFAASFDAIGVAGAIADAINGSPLAGDGVIAVSNSERVSIIGDQDVALGVGSTGNVIQGATGEAPILEAVPGDMISDGDTFTIDTLSTNGSPQVFEFDTGYVLTVPAAGGVGISDGATFTIENMVNGTNETFEFDKDGSMPANAISISDADTPAEIAAAIANAIAGAAIGLTPAPLPDGTVVVGGTVDDVLTNNSELVVTEQPGVTDMDAVPVPVTPAFTAAQVAQAIADAIVDATVPPVIINVLDGDMITDGSTVAIQDGDNTLTVEFDSDGMTRPGNIVVMFNPGDPADPQNNPPDLRDVIAQAFATAVNNATPMPTQITAIAAGFGGRVVIDPQALDAEVQVAGDRVVVNGRGVTFTAGTSAVSRLPATAQIQVEETTLTVDAMGNPVDITAQTIGAIVEADINQNPAPIASSAFERINFHGALEGDFSGVPVWVDRGSRPGVSPTHEPIIFFAGDQAFDFAGLEPGMVDRIADAINAVLPPLATATAAGKFVRLSRGNIEVGAPFISEGTGPGGLVTGITITASGGMYAVSDNGGLFELIGADTAMLQTRHIDTSDLLGIPFSGLTVGPPNVQDGAFADMLFGTTQSGLIYAFDTDGILQPIFAGGATSVATGLGGVNGLEFSPHDQNLWHATPPNPAPVPATFRDVTKGFATQIGANVGVDERQTLPGHGLYPTPTDSRINTTPGNSSFHFGLGNVGGTPRDYDFPGGTQGSMVSNEFSLEGYSASDVPILYFNYYLETEDAAENLSTPAPMRDSFRVFISNDGGDWDMLATNNHDTTALGEQGLYGATILQDNTNQWLQARIGLGNYAGQPNLRLRMDFNTAGTFDTGTPFLVPPHPTIGEGGDELRAISGAQLNDGETFVVGDTTFEFDSGLSFLVPTGNIIADGETFMVSDDTDTLTYEFDTDGTVAADSIAVPVSGAQTAAELAMRIADLIGTNGPANVTAIVADHIEPGDIAVPTNFVNFVGATAIVQGLAPSEDLLAVPLIGNIGVADGNAPVTFDHGMTREEIAEQIDLALESTLPDQHLLLARGSSFADGETFTISDGVDAFTFEFDSGIVIAIPPAGGTAGGIADGDTIEITDGATNILFEFDTDGTLNSPTATAVPITVTSTQLAVARSLQEAILNHPDAAALGLNPVVTSGADLQLPGSAGVTAIVSSTMTTTGTPGVTGTNIPIPFVPSDFFEAAAVATVISDAITNSGLLVDGSIDPNTTGRITLSSGTIVDLAGAPALSLGPVADNYFVYGDLIRIIGTFVADPGPLGIENLLLPLPLPDGGALPGDTQGSYGTPSGTLFRATNNNFEGIYVDDFVIGFAERGEMITNAVPNTVFTNPPPPPYGGNIVTDGYQLEIRPSSNYLNPPGLGFREFDTNDRLSETFEIIAPNGFELNDDQTFVVSDGLNSVEFIFEDVTPVILAEGNDTLVNAFDSTIRRGDITTFRGLSLIGDSPDATAEGDVDLIVFEVEVGTRFSIDVDAAILGSSVDTFVRLFDQDGVELAHNNDGRGPDEIVTVDGFIDFIAPYTGLFYAGISGNPNQVYDPHVANSGVGAGTGPYIVEIRVGDRGGLGPNTIPFDASDTSDVIARRIVNMINGENTQSILDVSAATSDGAFRITEGSTSNRVQIFGENIFVGELSKDLLIETDEIHNDTIATAVSTGLLGGEAGSYTGDGRIGDNPRLAEVHELDVDFLSVELAAGDRLRVDVDAIAFTENPIVALSPLDSLVQVFDADGMLLANSDDDLGIDDPDPLVDGAISLPFDSFVEFVAEVPGTYYIGISAFDNSAYDPTLEGSGEFSSFISAGEYRVLVEVGAGTIQYKQFLDDGDQNRFRDQGQLILQGNRISNSLDFGIVIDAGPRDALTNSPHMGPVRVTREVNTDNLAPGVVVMNNIIYANGVGGIQFSGDARPLDSPIAATPFGRLVNNTIYGQGSGTGILVGNNASPTLLNNIVSGFGMGVDVDASSQTTVIGGMLFQGNGVNSNAGLGEQPIVLNSNGTLFVNADAGNFYLRPGSLAIDSSIDSVADRFELVTVRNPLGIDLSPIRAPERDQAGLLRIDDPSVDTPDGVGENVFKDRGALDRADFVGPTASLKRPLDNSPGVDLDARDDVVRLDGVTLRQFIIQLRDEGESQAVGGIGIDNQTVTANSVNVLQNGVPLTLGEDYRFDYDATTREIRLTPQAGIWLPEFTYTMELVNSPISGIADLAGNPLRPNKITGDTTFNITIGSGLDFGDANAGSQTLLPSGARHEILPGFFLGAFVDAERDGQPNALANGDGPDDDGVIFASDVRAGKDTDIAVTASLNGVLNAWIDYDGDSSFDVDEQVFTDQILSAGQNVLTTGIPLDAAIGNAMARFRFSSIGGLTPTGLAPDGEVEDYVINIRDAGQDFGDAPERYPTQIADNGARHRIVPDLFLGAGVDDESDGQFSEDASGDGGDEDGVSFDAGITIGQTSTVTVTASADGRLDAWIDYNDDGTWDAGEQIFVSEPLVTGVNTLSFSVPNVTEIDTFARFRFSSAGGLAPSGAAADGEVEDYAVTVAEPGQDFGDAPADYPVQLAANGARHVVTSQLFLGQSVDAEDDGQPSLDASLDGSDDDGIAISALRTGFDATITVTASGGGFLDGWIDLNQDGDWTDPGERIFDTVSVDAGVNPFTINVDPNAKVGTTFARFRLSSSGGLEPTGEAEDGEVEDYAVTIELGGWHNTNFAEDVNDDGFLAPLDALLIINELDERLFSNPDTGELPIPSFPPPFVDVNDDRIVAPLDALLVINALETQAAIAVAAPLAAGLPAEGSPRASIEAKTTVTETSSRSVVISDLALRTFQRPSRRDVAVNSLVKQSTNDHDDKLDLLFADWE